MSVKRKHISDRTHLAAALLALGDVPYEHAKQMHEDQIISLYQFDHGVLHADKDDDMLRLLGLWHIDHFSNLTPRLIREHREKTKRDVKTIAKGKRLRQQQFVHRELSIKVPFNRPQKRKLHSRGFNKSLTRKFSGEVVQRRKE
jgi:hypothetical protein